MLLLVPACPNSWARHQTVNQNVSVTPNVQTIWLVFPKNAETLVLDLVDKIQNAKFSVTLLIAFAYPDMLEILSSVASQNVKNLFMRNQHLVSHHRVVLMQFVENITELVHAVV